MMIEKKEYTSKEFLELFDTFSKRNLDYIDKILVKYDKNNLLEYSLLFNSIISDLSNTYFDCLFGKDEDRYYQIPVRSKEFKDMFYKKYKQTSRRKVDRVYEGIIEFDMNLELKVNIMETLKYLFGSYRYDGTFPIIIIFSWFLRRLSDSLPFIICNYCNGKQTISKKEYFGFLLDFCTMMYYPFWNLYHYKLSTLLDDSNIIYVTYYDGYCDFHIKEYYTGMEKADDQILPMRPLRVLPNSIYNSNDMSNPGKTSFYNKSEFNITINKQYEFFSDYINKIDAIPLKNFRDYAKFITDKVGNEPFYKYNSHKNFLQDIQSICKVERSVALELLKHSSIEKTDAFGSFSTYKPIIKLKNYYYLMPHQVPKWFILLCENNAEPSKSYQIQMGFNFEDEVKRIMAAYKLVVLDVKRLKDTEDSEYANREFDVLVDIGDTIYDFQCKNYRFNYNPHPLEMDTLRKEHDLVLKRIKAGLDDEEGKKDVLFKKYKKNIEFFAISRFPLFTRNPKVISFNVIDEWLSAKTGQKRDIMA